MGEDSRELLDKWVLAKVGRSVKRESHSGGVSLVAIDVDGYRFGEGVDARALEGGTFGGRPVLAFLADKLVQSIRDAGRWDV